MVKYAVIGLHWGDEGKAKVIDFLIDSHNIIFVARYGGGSNAGHTQWKKGKGIATHLIPGGITHTGVYNALFSNTVVLPDSLIEEMDDLRRAGYEVTPMNFGISGLCKVTLPYHQEEEALSENMRGNSKIGTTGKAIGPTYRSSAAREGLRFREFLDPDTFRRFLEERNERIKRLLHYGLDEAAPKSRELTGRERAAITRFFRAINGKHVNVDEYMERFSGTIGLLRPFLIDEAKAIEVLREGNWVYEGSQAVLLDVDLGTYPFTTSSNPGRPPQDIDKTMGVAKAYMTRVGGGPFPTRMEPQDEERIRERGKEFGATTGRPRNCGWFDLLATRYSCNVGRVDEIALTRLDILTGEEKLKFSKAYRTPKGIRTRFPDDRDELREAMPIYTEVPGWIQDIRGIREFNDLPQKAKDYVKRIEDACERPVTLIGVGPAAEETIIRN